MKKLKTKFEVNDIVDDIELDKLFYENAEKKEEHNKFGWAFGSGTVIEVSKSKIVVDYGWLVVSYTPKYFDFLKVVGRKELYTDRKTITEFITELDAHWDVGDVSGIQKYLSKLKRKYKQYSHLNIETMTKPLLKGQVPQPIWMEFDFQIVKTYRLMGTRQETDEEYSKRMKEYKDFKKREREHNKFVNTYMFKTKKPTKEKVTRENLLKEYEITNTGSLFKIKRSKKRS